MTKASEVPAGVKRIRLLAPALAIDFTECRPALLTLPAGSALDVTDWAPSAARLLAAMWGERTFYGLRRDLEATGSRIACAPAA